MKKAVQIVVPFILVLLLFSCKTQNMGLDSEIDAGALANEYARNKKEGDAKYKGKYLTIKGKVAQQYRNKYNENIILLMDAKNINGVKCVLHSASKQISRPLKQGEFIKLSGRCEGFDEYVVLKGCIIFKN